MVTSPEPTIGADRSRAVYLGSGSGAVFTILDLPPEPVQAKVGVLICPPFGWEDICSYRSRRAWAQALSAAGHPTARIDLPGTGDSGGSPRDPDRLEAWTAAVCTAAAWLRTETGCERVAAIGIGLGGLVACRAVALDGPIDDLVLWAVPARGRTLVRELRAFVGLTAGSVAEPDDPPEAESISIEAEGSLAIAGFLMTAETARSLEALDLSTLAVPNARRRRVLLLERDGRQPDARLREHFERSGATVTIGAGAGYGLMMNDPRLARAPREVFSRTISWLAAPAPDFAPGGPRASTATMPVRETLVLGGAVSDAVRETPVSFESASGRVFGILTEPPGGVSRAEVCVVWLNAGAIRRIGPNRMWVELARRWAAQGIVSVRLDLRGLGDAEGDERRYTSNDEYYVAELTDQALATLGQLEAGGLPGRFVLAGLCSGAYWSFRGALADDRVVGAFAINLWSFFWSEALVSARDVRRARNLLRRRESVASILAGARQGRALRAGRDLLGGRQRRAAKRGREREIDTALDLLRDRGTQVLLQFSGGELLYEDLIATGRVDRLARWPNIALDRIPGADHTFRALALQRHVHATLDHALERVLEGTTGAASVAAASIPAQPGNGRAM